MADHFGEAPRDEINELVRKQINKGSIRDIGIPATETFQIPNLSGDHSAGTTGTPVTDLQIANKKYVDDNTTAGGWTDDGAVVRLTTSSDSVGIGTASPDGTLHVHTATAGNVTASTNADDLVVENSDNAGISILTPNNKISRMFFGSPEDPTGAKLQWDNTTDLFHFGSSKAGAEVGINSGNDVEAIRIDASQNLTLAVDLAVTEGGTGASTFTDGAILLGSGTGAITALDATTKGNLVVGDGTTDPIALAVGTNAQVLTADSAEASGVKWAAAAGGGGASQSFIVGHYGDPASVPYSPTVTGSGTSSTGASRITVLTATTAGSLSAAELFFDVDNVTNNPVWDGSPELSFQTRFNGFANLDAIAWVGTGTQAAAPGTEKHMGFQFNWTTGTAAIQATNADGTTQKETNITFTLTANQNDGWFCIMDGSTNIKYYINNILKATVTDNLPSGTPNSTAISFGVDLDGGEVTPLDMHLSPPVLKYTGTN